MSIENKKANSAKLPVSRRFVVQFENGNEPFWLADWEGDPGRTVIQDNAKRFYYDEAKEALAKAIAENPHRRLVGLIQTVNGG